MFDRSLLFHMLDNVDINPAQPHKRKRREAHVTEYFFEQKILPSITNGVTSEGWGFTEQNFVKHWFKAAPANKLSDETKFVDRIFISQLLAHDSRQRFYLVDLVNQQEAWEFKFQEIKSSVKNPDGLQLLSVSPPSCVKVTKILKELHRLIDLPQSDELFFETWFENVSDHDLLKLLIQRIIMNHGIKYPLDIDALEVIGEDEAQVVRLHEFKRKDHCPNGTFRSQNTRVDSKLLKATKKNLEDHLKKGNTNLASALDDAGFTRDSEAKCYGIDMSHVRIMEFCESTGFQYLHSIWDSAKYPKRPSIDDLLTTDYEARHGIDLYSHQLTPQDLTGLTYTRYQDSGTFSNKLRLQATIDTEKEYVSL